MLTKSPRRIRRTGDNSPATSVWRFVWRMTGRSQVLAITLAVLTTLAALAPIELQRRMIDDALPAGDVPLLMLLGGIYLFSILALQALKFALGMVAGWLS
ncbi:MAG: ABC transporter ATP-binding protein, partial [Pseudomonadota bacterium]